MRRRETELRIAEIQQGRKVGLCPIVIIDKKFKLLCYLKNNLLEIHSSYFEVMKPVSSCYQSSPDLPNWRAHLGHPYQQFQVMIIPKSEFDECTICK
ncbi:hypothetical protein VP01_1877g1 [Puccinia sorghi]|uniref:Uncharacterized protein n=1 Tax=Puccinia sorghi TaxID=27349 RepID=A0A0L6VD84_9BASI|nr:hypothetical protein VP01_1877g1 [Puccinia sorghi]